ncbi:ATP-binding protein [uncultured Adlercreutzia sp.]|uniref:ATP-binding protein n=1 Tax=uncultured Adlercreutzia sp. TaxID=875803 RepID=UPI0025F0E24B|nr:AAA family ATPase [uncultured Adlercreutzia sp.]
MERFLMHDLKAWKDNASRKPLIINGARQVGKTWLIKEFGRLHYESVAYVNMDNNAPMRDLFNAGYDIDTLLAGIQLQTGTTIDPATTLIVFDEVQENPKALTALKYFGEDPRSFSIIAAGSLLGILLQSGTGFPVGKVETLNLYPLSFQEFALASEGAAFVNALQSSDPSLIQAFKSRAIALLKSYYFVGGMPEAVDAFLASGDYQAARTVQRRILADYERDFSKHIPPREAERVFAVWDSIVAHLSQENKKFIFGRLAKGARAKDFESALTWLRQAGIIYQVPRVTKPGIPLKAYRDAGAFKAFLLDVGLLGAMSDVDSDSILNGNSLFEEFKGALTEQYACQELVASCRLSPWYWSAENSRGELDFLVQNKGNIFAIEVKAEENLRAKSLRSFKEKYPAVHARRFSLSDYREQEWLTNVPLYLMGNAALWLN